MSSVDLNIIERGLKGQSWTAEKGPITAGDLAKISEKRTNNSGALNALQTPFARFFVVKEAFRRALEEVKNSSKIAGEAYNRLVSDTLDVFELLYNLTYDILIHYSCTHELVFFFTNHKENYNLLWL